MEWITIIFWLASTLVVVLGPIILVHELGHFLLAKWAGVRVEEFGLGFPPRLLKLWRGKGYLDIGSTRVAIPAGLPNAPIRRLTTGLRVGTWVESIATRRDDGTYHLRRLQLLRSTEPDLVPEHEPVDESRHTERSETLRFAQGDDRFAQGDDRFAQGDDRSAQGDDRSAQGDDRFAQGDDRYAHDDRDERIRGEVTEVEPGTLYSLNMLPMGAFVKLTGEEDPSDPRSLAAQPKRWRVAVLAAGAVLNIIVAVMLVVGAYASGYPEKWIVQVTRVEPGSVAEGLGIQPGDLIVSAGGERIEQGMEQLQGIIRAVPGQAIELAVVRGTETLMLTAVPERTSEGYGQLGIWMAPWPDRSALRRYGLPEALSNGIGDISAAIVATAQIPARLVRGDISTQEARPASMVGISEVLAFTLQQSIAWGVVFPVLHTAALISLALGLTNLLPIPALDGGRILFVLIEAVRGRRISAEQEALIHFVGLLIMVGLMVLVMLQDLINPIIPWSWLK